MLRPKIVIQCLLHHGDIDDGVTDALHKQTHPCVHIGPVEPPHLPNQRTAASDQGSGSQFMLPSWGI